MLLSRQTFNARRLLLISAPSMRVCLSELDVSAPRSLPNAQRHTLNTSTNSVDNRCDW